MHKLEQVSLNGSVRAGNRTHTRTPTHLLHMCFGDTGILKRGKVGIKNLSGGATCSVAKSRRRQ